MGSGQDAIRSVDGHERAAGVRSLPRSSGLIDALRAGVPNEACGILVSDRYWADGGVALRWVGLRNAAESPYRYMIDAQEQLQVWTELDDADEVVWAIVHSHVASPARPSQTDVGLAFYPDSLYVVVLAQRLRPSRHSGLVDRRAAWCQKWR